jgi:CHAD domain-containing protein
MTAAATAENRAPQAPESGIHHEVEVKLDADPGFVLPDLSALPGVGQVQAAGVQELDAVYLDSADLRLIRHGTTFRRRTGGTDAGWHLKLPAAKRGRIEVQRPAGRSVREVPADLLGLVRAALRGAPVAPTARISTRRTVHLLIDASGGVLAEVADDLVTAKAMGAELTTSSWREIEVELVQGDDLLLAAASSALIAAGARPASSSSKLRRTLARRLASLEPVEPSVKDGKAGKEPTAGQVAIDYLSANLEALIAEDPRVRIDQDDAVHQMRVATRRLRTALATFRPLFTVGAGEELRAELKWAAGVLGEARDAEVMRARLTSDIAALPAELVLGPVQRRVDLELGEAYRKGHDGVLEALDSERYLALIAGLEEFIARPPFTERAAAPASKQAPVLARRAARRVFRAVAALDRADDADGPGGGDTSVRDVQLHEVRIAAKRLRYAAEALRPVAGREAKRLADVAEQIQETLGNHQDAVVQRQWLRDLGARAFVNGENGFTFGLLHGLTKAAALHDVEQFTKVWKQARTVMAAWPS